MIFYETMYIVHPALEAGRLKDLILSIEKTLLSSGGITCAINVWGKKKLAYPINKEKYGMYILFQFQNIGSKNKEFNLSLEHNSNILAYLTTKINQDQIIEDLPNLDIQLGLLNPEYNQNKESKSEESESEASKPEESESEASKPEASESEASKPEASESEASKSEESELEASKSEESNTEENK